MSHKFEMITVDIRSIVTQRCSLLFISSDGATQVVLRRRQSFLIGPQLVSHLLNKVVVRLNFSHEVLLLRIAPVHFYFGFRVLIVIIKRLLVNNCTCVHHLRCYFQLASFYFFCHAFIEFSHLLFDIIIWQGRSRRLWLFLTIFARSHECL